MLSHPKRTTVRHSKLSSTTMLLQADTHTREKFSENEFFVHNFVFGISLSRNISNPSKRNSFGSPEKALSNEHSENSFLEVG